MAITAEEAELLQNVNTDSYNSIIRVTSSSGQEIKDVERPSLDIEYVGVAPNQRVNLVVRVPKFMPQYKSVLVELGARYYGIEKLWRMPAFLCLAIACEETFVPRWIARRADFNAGDHIDLSDGYQEWKQIAADKFDELRINDSVKYIWNGHDPECKVVGCPQFHGLYPFQKDAVRWLVENPYGHPGSLMALSPGLGKTVVALTAATILGFQRVLIVAPLSLLSVWQQEKNKWFNKHTGAKLPAKLITVHSDSPPEDGWVVTNYNTVTSAKRIADFCEYQWDCMIIDESVQIKNRKSQRFMNIKNLRQSADMVWELSGSPITKHPSDLWSQFNLIDQRGFRSFWRFTRRWCSVEESDWGTKITGSSGRNLRDDFRDLLFVKNQEEVLPDLPDMLFEHINCPIQFEQKQLRIYKKMADEFIAELEETGDELSATTKLAQMIRLQQITSNIINLSTSLQGRWPDISVKANALIEMVESEAVEYPMLVWTHWRPGAQALTERLQSSVETINGYRVAMVQGDMSEEDRTNIFRRFKGTNNCFTDADIDILVLSLGVGKYGLSMQKTKTIVYMDKSFMADDYVQSLFRVRRIGLTHSPRVITLHCPGTIDEIVEENLAGKSVDIAHVTNANLAKMLRSLNRQLDLVAA